MVWQMLVVGVFAGILSGLFGIGGGLVIVPSLVFFLGVDIKSAVGISLAALLLPVGLMGVITYYQAGHVQIKTAALIALGLFIGTTIGAKTAQPIPGTILNKIYAIFLIVVAVRMLLTR